MRTGAIFWGFVLIIIGGLLLLQNLGYLENVDLWGLIWSIAFIAFGIWVLLGAVLKPSGKVQNISVPLEGAARAVVKLNRGIGKLTMAAGAPSGDLLSGEIRDEIKLKVSRSGDNVEVKCSQSSDGFLYWFSSSNLRWDVYLNPEIPLTLKIESGIGQSNLDLSGLSVEALKVNPGVGETNLTLPSQAGFTQVNVEGGVGAVNVRIPGGVGARIRVQQGLGAVNVDRARFPRSGNYYVSADYNTAANKVDLDVQTGVGAISITG